ncbi:MAG: sulfite exporter TauE/SafE family protein [Phascolarctobacterium sp.]
MIFFGMMLLGILLGFAGAGGAGLTITLLTVGFGVPIHTALGIALAAMGFTMLSGTISHFREGDVNLRIGLTTGFFGIVGATIGSQVSHHMSAKLLAPATASMLLVSVILLYFILFRKDVIDSFIITHAIHATGLRFFLYSMLIGLTTGFLSGAFGIGATAFIQISLMLFMGLSLYHAIGTTMLIILPISVAGGFNYLINGYLDLMIFLQTLMGLTIGAYIGAKFTRMASKNTLRYIIISMPTIGGLLLLYKH